MKTLDELIAGQTFSAFTTDDKKRVILYLGNFPLSSTTTLTPEQAIDLATELIATANRIQMKEAA